MARWTYVEACFLLGPAYEMDNWKETYYHGRLEEAGLSTRTSP